MALDSRSAEFFTKYHERARTRDPGAIYSVVRILLTPILWFLYRTRAIGAENVPAGGPAILAPNHFSLADHFFLALFLRRKVRFMAKSDLFVFPLNWILSHGGSFPVRRQRSDNEAIVTAESILEHGQVLGIYAEGGRSKDGKLREPRRGLGRIALDTGAPVVPVAIHGTSEVHHFKRLRFPKITIQYGEPLRFGRVAGASPEEALGASQAVFGQVSKMYRELDRVGRRGVIRAQRASRAIGAAA